MDPRTAKCKEKYEGKEYFCNDGIHTYVIKEFIAANNVIILFPDAGLEMSKSVYEITHNKIAYPFKGNCPLYFEDNVRKYEKSYFRTNEGYVIQIIKYNNISDVIVKFQDEHGYEMHTTIQNVCKGQVHNPYKINKFGGYEGEGPYKTNEFKWLYRIWYNMLIRANNNEYYLSYHGNYTTSSYDYCTIDPYFLCYNNFASWYMHELSLLNPKYSYEVDKDLMFRFYSSSTSGRKCYGPNTCVLIPHELNNKLQLFNLKKMNSVTEPLEKKKLEINISRASNEIKSCALKYYEDNAISTPVYNIIMNS